MEHRTLGPKSHILSNRKRLHLKSWGQTVKATGNWKSGGLGWPWSIAGLMTMDRRREHSGGKGEGESRLWQERFPGGKICLIHTDC